MKLICPVCCESVPADGSDPAAEVACPRCGSSISSSTATAVDGVAAVQAVAETRSWSASSDAAGAAESSLVTELPQIPGYDVLGFIARGGMGIVVKARHVVLDRPVAIKLPLPHQLATDSDRSRFLREARSAARLRHPHICPIYEVGEHAGRPYIAMGFIDGTTLRDWAKERRPSARQAATMVAALARAVGYAHEHGVVHRDIKPSNVMVDRETGEPVLMDFGLAKELADQSSQVTRSGQVMGTPAYMAPEQAAGHLDKIGPLSDVYALGAVLYELLCDRPPFLGSVGEVLRAVQTEEPTPPRRLAPRVHRDLKTICLKALAKDQAARYRTAIELAADLDRFNLGETILARREGPARRLWRRVRRSPATAVSVLGVLVALVVAGYVGIRAIGVRRATLVTSRFEAGLDRANWDEAHVTEMESLVDAMAEHAPEQAAPARARLHQRLAESIEQQLREATLLPEDITAIEASLTLLERRDADRVPALRRELAERLQRTEPVFRLAAPFADLSSVLEPDTVRVEDAALVPTAARPDLPSVTVTTRVPCQGRIELEAVFAPSWSAASELGVTLNAADLANGTARRGYTFLLQTASAPTAAETQPDVAAEQPPEPARPASFGKVREAGESFRLIIRRGGVALREQSVSAAQVPDTELRLTARRHGDRLSFQINDLPPLQFQDAFPLSAAAAGVFAIEWPAGVKLARLSASRQAAPVAPSPLERGDELYARGEFNEALAYFREQAIASGDTEAGQEARTKEGLCLVALNRHSEAATVFVEVAAKPGPRWPLVAACQLWLIHLRERSFEQADAVFESLAVRYRYEELASLIPSEVRDPILATYRNEGSGLGALRYNPNRVRNLERLDAIDEFLGAADENRIWTKWALLRACRAAELHEQALRTANEVMLLEQKLGRWTVQFALEICWLYRDRGEITAAENLVEQRLRQGSTRESTLPLLTERARVRLAHQKPEAAEQDVEEFFRQVGDQDMRYYYLADACLLRGFLRADRGDERGAIEAWRRGCFPRGPAGTPVRLPQDGMEILYGTILGSLTGELSEAEVEAFLSRALFSQPASSPAGLLKAYRLSPAVLQNMWRSPRGRELARQIAYRSITFAGVYRAAATLLAFETLHEGAVPGELSSEHDTLLWELVTALYERLGTGKLSDGHLLALALTWKGNTSALGWAGVSKQLDPAVRGPIAYFTGHRYLRQLNRPQDAANFFRAALSDAPADSLLARLAKAELERLGMP